MARTKDHVKRRLTLQMTLAGRSTAEIAEELNVNEQTIRRWRREPEFDEALQEAHAEMQAETHAILMASQSHALRALRAIIAGEDSGNNGNAKIKGIALLFELVGKHKNAPIERPQSMGEVETEDDLLAALQTFPEHLLRAALAARADGAAREREL